MQIFASYHEFKGRNKKEGIRPPPPPTENSPTGIGLKPWNQPVGPMLSQDESISCFPLTV